MWGRSVLRLLLSSAALVFSVVTSLVHATEEGMTALPAITLDGRPSFARFAAGLSLDDGQTFPDTANTSDNILIQAAINPDPSHVGMKGDIFVVEKFGNKFFMRTPSGTFVPWSYRLSDLVPAMENVTLTSSLVIDAYEGKIGAAGTHAIFIAYLPAGATNLVYTSAPLKLNIAGSTDALNYFTATLFDTVVLKKCVLCHVKGGIADGRAELIFINDITKSRENFDIFSAFFAKKPDALNYILSKVSGGNGHVGGIQLPLGSGGYTNMAGFLDLLAGGNGPAATSDPLTTFFAGVTYQSNQKTLRRAAILLAGRAPTTVEQQAVASGYYTTLRTTLRNLMQGENFHAFLKDAANDRLLVRGYASFNPLSECPNCFPAFSNKYTELEKTGIATGKTGLARQYASRLDFDFRESALELVASVVERDRPYSEILTADYTMMNADMNQAVQGNAAFTTGKAVEFKPGRFQGYYRNNETVKVEYQPNLTFWKILDPGNLRTPYPHVGILNDPGFLYRYPSTSTNRNRAHARWTFYNFLGVDIEQSAQRTTDPVALADTDNPTMKNPSCTVCHAIMDPVAGAFQDYGFLGFYKTRKGGMDSLDNYYTNPKNPNFIYQPGDTWYRDMRAPGFNQVSAEGAPDSLRWLAEHIVSDSRFTTAAVRFWWPAIIGRELLKRPEVTTDPDYLPLLSAYEAQEATVSYVAANFARSGMNVKTLFTDLLLSEWFRAESIDPARVNATQLRAHQLAGLGNEKLLTPEQLARKTRSLTGFNWSANEDLNLGTTRGGLEDGYRLLYGGIDSVGVTTRARMITPLMSTVVQTHALESACPIVMGEFILEDAERLLFGGIDATITPLTEASKLQSVTSLDADDVQYYSLSVDLNPGSKSISVSFINDYCDFDAANNGCLSDRNLYLDAINIVKPGGAVIGFSGTQGALSGSCSKNTNGMVTLYGPCTVEFKFNADQKGTYTVNSALSATRSGTDFAIAHVSVNADTTAEQSQARGAVLIRNKLVQLHQKLLGQAVAPNSPEINALYSLLVQTWSAKRSSNLARNLYQSNTTCDTWGGDPRYAEYVGYPGQARILQTGANGSQWKQYDWGNINPWLHGMANDPEYMKQTWVVIMSYYMTHYNYLYE